MSKSPALSPVSIKRFFIRLPEPRSRLARIKHPLINLVVIALCGVIGGADTWEEIAHFARVHRDWLAELIDLQNGLPSHDTLERVFAALDPIAFQKCLLAWVTALHTQTQGQIIAIDGKAAREAMARSADKGPLCLVSAWATANCVCLGQVAGPAGSNELGALPKLLELLELKGAIVTLDALGCQKDLVGQIVDQGGDYVISVKGNQEALADAVHQAFTWAFDTNAQVITKETQEQGHGRTETRRYVVLEIPDDFPEKDKWAGLRSLVMVSRDYVNTNGQEGFGVRYFISSVPARRARTIAEAVRSHWLIENELHWRLDVAFREDVNRSRDANQQANLGLFRRTALTLLKNATGLEGSMNCRRKQAGWDTEILQQVLFGSTK
jgi:predicted transposase YbfD/YdcC